MVSLSTICHTFQWLGFTRKKLQHIVLKRSENDRSELAEEISYIDPNMIGWVGSNSRREGIRKFGYAICRITPVSFKLGISGKCPSVITAMSTRRVVDINIIEGTTNEKLSAVSYPAKYAAFLMESIQGQSSS